MIKRLPKRFHWTIHNIIGHPASEIFKQLGLTRLSVWAHDITEP